ncbi:MAG: DUF499 domain-containing protein [Bifidobacteriaceae bacterium]|jgi:predicted AAA+ superfamily ATPase|nr:DUF499 domain-containing protein [Bifidobacteriaceae bacterium]
MNNRDRVGKGFDLLVEGLTDPVDDVMRQVFGNQSDWNELWAARDALRHGTPPKTYSKNDALILLRAITEFGREFASILSRPQQAYASELRETRNLWAHSEPFSSDDTIRALDTMERLLLAVNAPDSAEDVRKLRLDLQATVVSEQARQQTRRPAIGAISVPGTLGMKPWREVIQPHNDVAQGQFTAAEFAADLHQVAQGLATAPEYADPVEFFNRTFLTEGLRDLLNRALTRIVGDGSASPIVNLQTNFGGGKTHSMLALYHLFGDTPVTSFPQELQELIVKAGAAGLRGTPVRRVAIVGNRMKAGSASVKDDGTEVRTVWGELAWQLGGKEGFALVAADDAAGTNPGSALQTLLEKYGPALILIDEWVAYARDLVGKDGLPGGSFDTQFTFAQTLTETVESVPGTMLVVSIPASDSGERKGNDIEIGGTNGHEALRRLQNVIRRKADQWRPSSKDESFEIVRRRLFQTPGADGLASIAATARKFVTMYRENQSQFPRHVSQPGTSYEARIKASYPLHPELLDRLYEDWSALERFQRTRGVLKLISSVVHELWAEGDTSPLILPGNVPLAATTVNTDLTQYLEDSWRPIIDGDIDGPQATAARIDNTKSSLGSRHVTRRIARTVFMGAAPRSRSARKGLDKQYVWLGTAVPGDALGNFGAALDAMEQESTYFYADSGHYWFDTQASVTKTASDYAERLREDPDTVWNEIVTRLRSEERSRGEFDRVHIAPESSGDIPDLEETRLVIVHPRHSVLRGDGSESGTHQSVRQALETRGSAQRTHRNSLIFLVADRDALESLESSVRAYLGWKLVQSQCEQMNLTAQQKRQADDSVARNNQVANDRLRDTFVWCLYPSQPDPTRPFELVTERVPDSTGKSLAQRVSDRLVNRLRQLFPDLGPTYLGAELNGVLRPAWQGAHISVGEVWSYFTRYPYLPRLTRRAVLDQAVRDAAGALLVGDERFAIASGYDQAGQRYRGLIIPPNPNVAAVHVTDQTLLVDWAVAMAQFEAEHVAEPEPIPGADPPDTSPGTDGSELGAGGTTLPVDIVLPGVPVEVAAEVEFPRVRFFGQVRLDPTRYARDMGNVQREILDRLAGADTELDIIIDIQARRPKGFTEAEVRTISENARTLKFDQSSLGFATD